MRRRRRVRVRAREGLPRDVRARLSTELRRHRTPRATHSRARGGRSISSIARRASTSMPRARRASRARRERVIIIGGGAAGCAAAFCLRARDATVMTRTMTRTRTMTTTSSTSNSSADASRRRGDDGIVGERVVINDGVQGGTVSYANVARLMRECASRNRAE